MGGGSRDRSALSSSSDSPPTAIRRDPEACEKLEATVLRLRRDQKGRVWAGWGGDDLVGRTGLVTVLLPTEALLRFCVTWNTNSRHCHEAQAVLGVLLRHEAPEELLAYEGVQGALEALLPYTGM